MLLNGPTLDIGVHQRCHSLRTGRHDLCSSEAQRCIAAQQLCHRTSDTASIWRAPKRARCSTIPTAAAAPQVADDINLIAAAPLSEVSPYGHGHDLTVTWGEVLDQMKARIANINPAFKLRVIDAEHLQVHHWPQEC